MITIVWEYKKYKKYSLVKRPEPLEYFLLRRKSDKILTSLIKEITGRVVLDVGCGLGYYTDIFRQKNNQVTGLDNNSALVSFWREKGENFICARAEDLAAKVDFSPEVIFSAWLTEYLDSNDLEKFFNDCRKVSSDRTVLIFTVIAPAGWGWVYVRMAGIFGKVRKYYYRREEIVTLLSRTGWGSKVEIIDLNAFGGGHWAYLVVARNGDKK